MNPSSSPSRRRFLQTAAASVGAPFILPSKIWSADASPNSRLRMGFIGMGTQNRGLMNKFLQYPEVIVTAVCDVDKTRREDSKEAVDKKYGNTDCKALNDFREITESKDFDAVCIATPDHWHAYITISALSHGKDVYCEKPLTHNIHEAVAVVEATRKNNRILQTGSMQRSMQEFRVAAELVRNGVIGKVKTIGIDIGDPATPNANPKEDMEPGLDWDRWCGPGPLAPYSSVLSPRGRHHHFPAWRMTREYGGGIGAGAKKGRNTDLRKRQRGNHNPGERNRGARRGQQYSCRHPARRCGDARSLLLRGVGVPEGERRQSGDDRRQRQAERQDNTRLAEQQGGRGLVPD